MRSSKGFFGVVVLGFLSTGAERGFSSCFLINEMVSGEKYRNFTSKPVASKCNVTNKGVLVIAAIYTFQPRIPKQAKAMKQSRPMSLDKYRPASSRAPSDLIYNQPAHQSHGRHQHELPLVNDSPLFCLDIGQDNTMKREAGPTGQPPLISWRPQRDLNPCRRRERRTAQSALF